MHTLKKVRHIIPILGIGVTWLVYASVSEFRRPVQFFICAALSVAVFFALRLVLNRLLGQEETSEEPVKQAAASTTTPEALYLQKIRTLDEQIPDLEVSAKLKQIGDLMRHIFDVVEKQPEKRKSVDRLTEYYLPTTIKLLEKYVILQEQKIQGEHIGDGMQKIEGLLDSVIVALQKQLDGMFCSDIIDITAEIRVMEKKMAAEGLAADDDFKEIL